MSPFGESLPGSQRHLSVLRSTVPEAPAGITPDIEVKQLRFLTPDVALIHADAVTKRGRRSRRPSRINTSVAVRTADGWMLAASQNTTQRRLAETLLQKLLLPTAVWQ